MKNYNGSIKNIREDNMLIKKISYGDKEAFNQLYKKYSSPVLFHILSRVADKRVANEILSDVFLKVFEKADKYVHNGAVSSWIYLIAKNQIIDHLRLFSKRQERYISIDKNFNQPDTYDEDLIDIQLPSHDLDPVEEFQYQELKFIVHKFLNALNPECRETIKLRFMEGFSYEEISKATNSSLSAVKSRIFQAKKQLKDKMGKKTLTHYLAA